MAQMTRVDWRVRNNAPWTKSFSFTRGGKPVDLTSKALKMDLANAAGETVFSLSTADGTIKITSHAGGGIAFSVPAARVRALRAGDYQYDLLILENGEPVATAMFGKITVEQGITH